MKGDEEVWNDELQVWEPVDPATEKRFEASPVVWGNLLLPWRRELFEFLIPEGGRRKLPEGSRTLCIWYDGARWKISLGAKDAQAVAFVTAETLTEVFAAVVNGLRKETLAWRPTKPPRQR